MSSSPPGRPRGQATTRWPTTSASTTTGRLTSPDTALEAAAGESAPGRPAASDSARARTRGTALPGSVAVT